MTSCEEAEKRPITIQSLSIPQLIQILQLDAAMTRWLRKSWPGARREGLANDQGASEPLGGRRAGENQGACWNGRWRNKELRVDPMGRATPEIFTTDDMRNISKEGSLGR
jgi:hypothetical protein